MNPELALLLSTLTRKPLLTRSDLALRYATSLRTIDRYTAAGILPRPTYVHTGPRWSAAQLLAWERARLKRPRRPGGSS